GEVGEELDRIRREATEGGRRFGAGSHVQILQPSSLCPAGFIRRDLAEVAPAPERLDDERPNRLVDRHAKPAGCPERDGWSRRQLHQALRGPAAALELTP